MASCGHAGAGYDEGTGSGMCDDGDIEQCSMSVGPPRGTSVLVGLRLPVPILASSGGDGANEEAMFMMVVPEITMTRGEISGT